MVCGNKSGYTLYLLYTLYLFSSFLAKFLLLRHHCSNLVINLNVLYRRKCNILPEAITHVRHVPPLWPLSPAGEQGFFLVVVVVVIFVFCCRWLLSLFVCLFAWGNVSLWCFGWPETHCIDQDDQELRDSPASVPECWHERYIPSCLVHTQLLIIKVEETMPRPGLSSL